MAVERIDPETAHDRVYSGKALLVCAYDSEEKFRENHLEAGFLCSSWKHASPAFRKIARPFSTALDRQKPRPPVGRKSIERKASRT
jgi:hypothetical protein